MLAKREQRDRIKPIEAGMHSAVCCGIVDLGLQLNNFNGKEQRKVLIIWDTDVTYVNDKGEEKTRMISQDYVLSLHEKAKLCKTLESWRGCKFTKEELDGFDLRTVLDKPCLLNITHTEKDDRVYANVDSVTPLMKGQAPIKRDNPITYFNMDNGLEGFDVLPNYLQERIKKSSTYEALVNGKPISGLIPADDDGLPF
jgi:hypothetical protein